ncbi:MAG: hypothetical protein WDO16_18770 [Bacteroidota bacterium]
MSSTPIPHQESTSAIKKAFPCIKVSSTRKGRRKTPMTLLIIKTIKIYVSAPSFILKIHPDILRPMNLTVYTMARPSTQ